MKIVLPALLGLLALIAGPSLAGDADHGKALYAMYCTQCHGIRGDGHGINAPALSVMPRDHTDRGEMSARTDDDLAKAIRDGGKAINKSILMPAWGGNLNDSAINDLIAYLRALCCHH